MFPGIEEAVSKRSGQMNARPFRSMYVRSGVWSRFPVRIVELMTRTGRKESVKRAPVRLTLVKR